MSNHKIDPSVHGTYELQQLLEPPADTEPEYAVNSACFERIQWDSFNKATLILDRFPDETGASCCFLRIPPGDEQMIRFIVKGGYQAVACLSGGWLLKPVEATLPSYWIPQAPVLRTFDSSDRILSETSVSLAGFMASSSELTVDIETPGNMHLDITVWRFLPEASYIQEALERPLVLETQSIYLWNSQTGYKALADVYLYLVHGHVYTNRFIWPHMWKICSELDAYTLYVTLDGLELATNKKLYSLLKRQLLFSVITRQARDGGWYHGEWTDLMESHYRFHNGALLLLEAGLEEWPEDSIREALENGASFISRQTDNTDYGLWFLHDSLENSAEMMDELSKQTGSRWIPNHIFGKSPTNKLILNTHLDSIVALDRYSKVTGDNQYNEFVASARAATRAVLGLQPAELLYRLVYRAIGLTLLPASEAERLPFLPRAIKRLTWMYITPQLYRLKRIFPRFVMPGGLIERHLSMPHCDFNYPAVNVMDLARYWRCFPEEDLADILNNAIKAVTDTSIMKYWAEVKAGNPQQFAVVVWVEALYNMCNLSREPAYRRYLAEAIMIAEDAGLGLPPSLLGSDHEAVKIKQRLPCPSPTDARLRVANLSCGDNKEFLVVNSADTDLKLAWEENTKYTMSWINSNGRPVSPPGDSSSLNVPSRDWLWGKIN
jgi:hypothetical protein